MKKPEEQKTHAVVSFSRMNPPTKGHLKLISRMKELAAHHGADHIVFLSPTQDADKNPLKHSDRIRFLEQMAPGTNIHKKSSIKNPYEMLDHLHKSGYRKVTLVAGEDRYHEMNNLLQRYNKDGKFEHINVSSAGKRDPDHEGVEGLSASKMREAAKKGDFKTFKKGTGSKDRKLYQATRKGMKMKAESYRALILVGGPGSGKDVLVRTVLAETNLTEINLDKLHKAIQDKIDLKTINEGVPLIVNGNADDGMKIGIVKTVLEAVGYETQICFVYTTNEISKARNDARIASGSKTITEEVRFEKWKESVDFLHKNKERVLLFNNSYDIRSLVGEEKEQVLSWLNELYDMLSDFFTSKEPSLDEAVEGFFEEKKEKTKQVNAPMEPESSDSSDGAMISTTTEGKGFKKFVKMAKPPGITGYNRDQGGIASATASLAEANNKTKQTKAPSINADERVGDDQAAVTTLGTGIGESKTFRSLRIGMMSKSPDGEFLDIELYEDIGLEGEQALYEGRVITTNKPFKRGDNYSVYIKDGDNVNRKDFKNHKNVLQEIIEALERP